MHVSGGKAIFEICTFKDCTAIDAQGGGALWVEATGSVELRARSRLHDNYAAGLRESIVGQRCT